MKKKWVLSLMLAAVLFMAVTVTTNAAGWAQGADGRLIYLDDEGGLVKSQWVETNGNLFFLDAEGFLFTNGVTPDGMLVGADGVFIGVAAGQDVQESAVQMSTITSTPTTVISPGTYKVGTEIAPGEYVLMCNNNYGAYYSINKDSTGSLGSIINNDNFAYNAIIKVQDGQYLGLSRCTLSPISEMPLIDYTKGTMFKIGYHLPPGEYKLQANSQYGGYYAVLKDTSGSIYDIVANDNFQGQTYVTVQDGQYLELSRCTIAEKAK